MSCGADVLLLLFTGEAVGISANGLVYYSSVHRVICATIVRPRRASNLCTVQFLGSPLTR